MAAGMITRKIPSTIAEVLTVDLKTNTMERVLHTFPIELTAQEVLTRVKQQDTSTKVSVTVTSISHYDVRYGMTVTKFIENAEII